MSGTWPPSPYFIPPYRAHAPVEDGRSLCERRGEHQGDEYETTDEDGNLRARWTCCDEEKVIGWAQPAENEDPAYAADPPCKRCGAATDDGEGYDGYCGNCADRAERAGEWGP